MAATETIDALDALELLERLDRTKIAEQITELETKLKRLKTMAKLAGDAGDEPAPKRKTGRKRASGTVLDRVQDWLTKHGPARTSEIAEGLGVGSGGVSTTLTHNPKLFKKGGEGLWATK